MRPSKLDETIDARINTRTLRNPEMLKWIETILSNQNAPVKIEYFGAYLQDPRHSFSVLISPDSHKSLLAFYHMIDDQDYDNIKFFRIGSIITFEYVMYDHAIENVLSKSNPDEWEIFSDKMPWNWVYEQFKLLAVKYL